METSNIHAKTININIIINVIYVKILRNHNYLLHLYYNVCY